MNLINTTLLIFPGIIIALLLALHKKNKRIHIFLISSVIWNIFLHLSMYAGLWLFDVRHFNIFEMSLRFKIKYLILEFLIAAFFFLICYFIKNRKDKNIKDTILRMFPTSLFAIVTYAIFVPSSLFLQNIDEFKLNYISVVPTILVISCVLWMIISLIPLPFKNTGFISYWIGMIFSVILCMYIQGNFLNPNFSQLDGGEINWSQYQSETIISTIVWLVCICVVLIFMHMKKRKAETVIKYVSYFISAVQVVTLLTLLLTTRKSDAVNYGFSKDDQFNLATQDNIIMLVVDSLDATTMHEYINTYPDIDTELSGFTFFDNAVSGGASTALAMPVMLTGVEYDPTWMDWNDYINDVWENANLYKELKNYGYDIQFFSDIDSFHGITPDKVNNLVNIENYRIKNPLSFSKSWYQLVNFFVMPQVLKERFWLTTETITENIDVPPHIYRLDDFEFYDELSQNEMQTTYSKAFRLYHLRGAHPSFYMTEDLEYKRDGTVTELEQVRGVFKIINEFLDEMKALGIYNDSTIIILGDHGQHEKYNLEANPAILIKEANTNNSFAVNSNPVHFRNLVATIADVFLENYSSYGPSLWDIKTESDVERMHTVYELVQIRFHADSEIVPKPHARYIIGENAANTNEYKLYEPAAYNRFQYNLSDNDIINFQTENKYTKELNYRIYKENGVGIASNELILNIELEDYKGGDVNFHFTYADVYNNRQQMRVYSKESRLNDIVCTTENIGTEQTINIPEESIRDSTISLRFVFPNAVTPHQLDNSDPDYRVLSVAFDSISLNTH